MPTSLFLHYSAYIEIKMPNKIARLLKKHQPKSVDEDTDKPFAFGNKWGDIFFRGADGNKYKIEGKTNDIDYKRARDGDWEEEVESDDEEVSEEVTNEKGDVVTEEKMKKLLGEEDEKDEKDEKDEEEPEEDE